MGECARRHEINRKLMNAIAGEDENRRNEGREKKREGKKDRRARGAIFR